MYAINKLTLASMPQAIIGPQSPRVDSDHIGDCLSSKRLCFPRRATPTLTVYVEEVGTEEGIYIP